MRNPLLTFALSGILMTGLATSAALAQSTAPAAPSQDATAGTPMGHGHGMHAPDPDKQLAHLTRKLNLSADQQAQIKPILTDRVTQMQALHADTTTARPDKMAKMKAINQDSESKLEAVLNDQQKTAYEQMRAEQKAKMQEHMQEHMQHKGGAAPQAAPAPATPQA